MLVNILVVALGSAAGGVLRYLSFMALGDRLARAPVATLIVNVLGSFAIGAVAVAVPSSSRTRLLLATGLCGGFTTFSAFAIDTIDLARDSVVFAALNIALNVVLSISACWLGMRLAGGS